jgi:hypothetical protein
VAVSCDYLVGLDELFDYKNQLMDDLLINTDIVKLMSDDGKTEVAPETLMYTQVFPYEFVPDVTEHGQTFICCEVDIKEVLNKTYLVPALYIWVFTHKSKVRLPGGGVRTDKLSSIITSIINGSRMYGLGELNLQSAKRFSPITNYQGRILTFYAKDFNRLAPSDKKVPANRKRG